MHATVLNRYATWHWQRAVGIAEKSNAAPPDFTTTRAFVLRENAPAPSMTEVKDFFRFYIASSCGRITENGRPTTESMVSRAEAFYRAFKHETGTETDPQQHTEIYRWMRRVLTAEGVLEDKKKEKYNLDCIALDRLLHAIWSDLTVPHERVRIQLHLLFMLYVTTGARIGALFAGNVTYKNKDIEIVQTRREGGGYRFFWRFDQRFVKNNRNTENDTFGSSARDHDVLLYCATALLLSLAFADDAMFGFDSLQSLYELEIPEGDNEIILRWNEDVLDLPIVRSIARDGTVTGKQLTESSFRQSFNKALKLAGYVGVSPSIHQIRRYLGKQVDERYTEVERSQHLTQSDRNIFGASYVANCSSVDGLGAFLGEQADHTAVNFFQGLEKFREHGAPIVLPAAIERALWQEEEVVKLQQRIELSEDSTARSKLVGALRNLRRKLKAKALESYRQQWVRERRDWKVLTRGKVAPEVSTAEGNQLVNFVPALERVEKLMLSMSPLSPENMRQAMQDLYVLASTGFSILYYPGEEPVAGECRFCGTNMSSMYVSTSPIVA
ncbi:hypothetical protein CT0861_13119 [Colletotrichum tofieldiae]|uniref:Uncharacterized protein n=1 Tax=Colletotrichum tofieldiae TaxID=708197 RepID=A0A166WBT8_9PEZI|nr:hypothetical protein CT0861_13119 [Colletotrichum tofieldiae]